MRKNMRDVIAARDKGKAKAGDSCSTDGRNIFSYATCLLAVDATGRFILNGTSYSRTTSTQQSALRLRYPSAVTVLGLRRGASPDAVIAAWDAMVDHWEALKEEGLIPCCTPLPSWCPGSLPVVDVTPPAGLFLQDEVTVIDPTLPAPMRKLLAHLTQLEA